MFELYRCHSSNCSFETSMKTESPGMSSSRLSFYKIRILGPKHILRFIGCILPQKLPNADSEPNILSAAETWSIFLFLLWLLLLILLGLQMHVQYIPSKLNIAPEKLLESTSLCLLTLTFDYCQQLSPYICIPYQL